MTTSKRTPVARGARFRFLIVVGSILAVTGLACAAQVPLPTPVPVPSVDIQATVTAAVAAALPRHVPSPTVAVDINATVEARVRATVAAMPTPAPVPTPIPTPTPTAVPPTPTAKPTPTPHPVEAKRAAPIVETNPYRIVQQSVVKVIAVMGQRTSQGSGVIVGRGSHVVTNAHVIEGATSNIKVSTHPEDGVGIETTGQVIFSSKEIDLALIKVGNTLGKPIDVSRSLPALGDTLVIGGFPGIGGETLTATKGTVAGFEYSGAVIKFDGQVGPGSSGGAAVNEEGKLVGITTALSREPLGGNLGLLLSVPVVAHTLARALLEDSRAEATGSQYQLGIVGLPTVAVVPDGWAIVVNFGYFDMRAPGTESGGLTGDYHVVGIFARDLTPNEPPEAILARIVAESGGGFQVVPDSRIEPPDGFSDCALLHNTERFEMSSFGARGSVIESGWLSVAGLYTRFCVARTTEKTLIGYVESPNREVASEDDLWLSSLTILPD